MKKTKILVIQLRQFGDVLCCSPFIRTLKKNVPNCDIYFLTERIGSLALENNPHIKKSILFPNTTIKLSQLILKMRKLKFDLCFDLMNIPKTAVFSWAMNAKIRIGFHKKGRWIFYTDAVKKVHNETEYMAETKGQLLNAIDLTLDSNELEYCVDNKKVHHIKQWCDEHFDRPVIALCPVGRRSARLWLNVHWAQLADMIIEQLKYDVIFIYGPGEKCIIDNISSQMNNEPKIPPDTDFNDLGYIFTRCSATVSNDTGPKHLSIAVKTPTLSINGPTIPQCWTPPNSIHSYITANVPCIGCERQECDDMKCMKQLTPEIVLEKLKKMIK